MRGETGQTGAAHPGPCGPRTFRCLVSVELTVGKGRALFGFKRLEITAGWKKRLVLLETGGETGRPIRKLALLQTRGG